MKVLFDIKDNKAQALLEILKVLSSVKFKILTEKEKKEILNGIKQKFKEAKLIRAGKCKAKLMKQLLDEL